MTETYCKQVRYMAIQTKEIHNYWKINKKILKRAHWNFGDAYFHWVTGHHAEKYRERYEVHAEAIDEVCKTACGYICNLYYLVEEDQIVFEEDVKGRRAKKICRLSMKKINELLEDGPGQPYEDKCLEDLIDDEKT